MSKEIDLDTQVRQGTEGYDDFGELMQDALDKASDQDETVYVRSGGKRIAAIVPVDVAEEHDRQIAEVMQTIITGSQCLAVPHERHGDCPGWPPDHRPVNQWVEVPSCRLLGHTQHEVAGIIYRPGNDGLLTREGAPPHAHWAGDQAAGHDAYMSEAQQ